VDFGTLAIGAIPSFIASGVEFVEATTIVLAVGVTRGWRAPLAGTIAAVATLAIAVGALGATLVAVLPEHMLKGIVGALLLLFGLRWLYVFSPPLGRDEPIDPGVDGDHK
jgi:uncharacterized membrane protein